MRKNICRNEVLLLIFKKAKSAKGILTVPGDKSISHRAVMFGSLAEGTTQIQGFLQSADCLSTISCFQAMGISIENHFEDNRVTIHGKGLYGLSEPRTSLDVGNSGTTMRLLSGILSGQRFSTKLTGDESIQKRPMNRVMEPLSKMNAKIYSSLGKGCAPLQISPSERPLQGIHYISPIASAQVKSALLLAGLYAESPTTVTEPYLSRNHTELMLERLGAKLQIHDATVTLTPGSKLSSDRILVPGDISSAAYFIALGLLLPDADLTIKNVGINPTRDGILRVCRMMGAKLKYENKIDTQGEPACDIHLTPSNLTAAPIGGSLIPTLIDELPILAVMACFAKGKTIISDAAELKVKESNRLDLMVQGLLAMGADVKATPDGMIIQGGSPLHGTMIDSHGDHRIAMAFTIAGLLADGETNIIGSECVTVSYPDFYEDLNRIVTR